MKTTIEPRTKVTRLLLLAALLAKTPALAADAEVQRQLQQREQQQTELRLKMQQQLDRSTQQPQSPAANLQMRQVDRDQQQRLRELHEQRMRGMVAPAPPGGSEQMRRDVERNRSLQNPIDPSSRPQADLRPAPDQASRP